MTAGDRCVTPVVAPAKEIYKIGRPPNFRDGSSQLTFEKAETI